MKFFFLCVFLSTAILPLDTIANNKDTIIALDSAYPPYMHGSKSKPKGLYANLLKEIFGKMKLSLTLEPKPWKRVMTKAKLGKWGVGGIYKNSERVKIFDYSEPIYYERLVLFTRKSSNIKFKKLSDLKGKVIGVMRGWSYGEDFDKAKKMKIFRVQETNEGTQSFKLLLKKRVDAVVMDSVSANIILKKEGWQKKVDESTNPVAKNAAYIVFLKTMDQKELINKFNDTVQQMKEDGSYQKIISEFIKD